MGYVKNKYDIHKSAKFIAHIDTTFFDHDCRLKVIEKIDKESDPGIYVGMLMDEINHHEFLDEIKHVCEEYNKNSNLFEELSNEELKNIRIIFASNQYKNSKKENAYFYHKAFDFFCNHTKKILDEQLLTLFNMFWMYIVFSKYNKKSLKAKAKSLQDVWVFMAKNEITLDGDDKLSDFLDKDTLEVVQSYYRSKLRRNIRAVGKVSPEVFNVNKSIIPLLKQLDDDEAKDYFNKFLNTVSTTTDLNYENLVLEDLKKGLGDLEWFNTNEVTIPYQKKVKEINNGLDPKNLSAFPGKSFVLDIQKHGVELANGLLADLKMNGQSFTTALNSDGSFKGNISIRNFDLVTGPLDDLIPFSESMKTSNLYMFNRLLGQTVFESIVVRWTDQEKRLLLEIYKKKIGFILDSFGFKPTDMRRNEYDVVFETYQRHLILITGVSPIDVNLNLALIETSIYLIEMLILDLEEYLSKSTKMDAQHLPKHQVLDNWINDEKFNILSDRTMTEIDDMLFKKSSTDFRCLEIRNNIIHKERGFLAMVSYQSLVTYLLMETVDEMFNNLMLLRKEKHK